MRKRLKKVKDRLMLFWVNVYGLQLARECGVHHKGYLYLKPCKLALRDLLYYHRKKRKPLVLKKNTRVNPRIKALKKKRKTIK